MTLYHNLMLTAVAALSSATLALPQAQSTLPMNTNSGVTTAQATQAQSLVPDEVAYGHLFAVLARGGNEDDQHWHHRQDAILGKIGLSPSDNALIKATIQDFSNERAAASAVAKQGFHKTNAEVHTEVKQMYTSLLQTMSIEGGTALSTYIKTTVKPRVRLGTLVLKH